MVQGPVTLVTYTMGPNLSWAYTRLLSQFQYHVFSIVEGFFKNNNKSKHFRQFGCIEKLPKMTQYVIKVKYIKYTCVL